MLSKPTITSALSLASVLMTACSGGGFRGDASAHDYLGKGSRLVLASRVDHLDKLTREPMLVQQPGGELFVAGYGAIPPEPSNPQQVPHLWRSDDHGMHWTPVDVGSAADGAKGNSDVDMTIGPDLTLYFANLGFDRKTERGTHVAVGVSHD